MFAWYCVRGAAVCRCISDVTLIDRQLRAHSLDICSRWWVLPPHVRQSQHFVTHLRLICIIIKQWKFITLPDSWSRNSLKEEKRRSFIHHTEFVFGYWNVLHSCMKRRTDRFAACVRCWGFRFCFMDHLCIGRRRASGDFLFSVSFIKDCYTFTWQTIKCKSISTFNYIS